jgi:hypothetical protein
MRPSIKRLAPYLLSCWLGVASAAFVPLDLGDFDDDLMRDMDNAAKDLEPVLGAGNGAAAKEDAEVLAHGFKWTEDYFDKKQVPDAVKFAKDSSRDLDQVVSLLEKKDFPAAAAAARDMTKACRTCHDVYKPPK